MNNMIKIGLNIPEANTFLKMKCRNAALSIYGDPLPGFVSERLNKELAAIIKSEDSSSFLFALLISDMVAEMGYHVTTRGRIGASFIAFLCGISGVNPLQPHYYCPDCHCYEVVDSRKYTHGFDLPDKRCPKCYSELKHEGSNMLPEFSFGPYLNREPDVIINLPKCVRKEVFHNLKERFSEYRFIRAGVNYSNPSGGSRISVHPGEIYIIPKEYDISQNTLLRKSDGDDFDMSITVTDYHDLDEVFKPYYLFAHPVVDMLHDLEKETSIKSQYIPMNNKSVIKVLGDIGFSFLPQFTEYPRLYDVERDVLSFCKPDCFSDVVRVIGLLTGVNTWNGNGAKLVKEGVSFRDLIYCRDDVYLKLIQRGIEKDLSWSIIRNIWTGKHLSESQEETMINNGFDLWYIESCNRIKYLFPKAHLVEYASLYYKLAYYRLYYPSEYNKIYLDYDLSDKVPF